MKKGDLYLANLNPKFGHEQSGFRPVIIMQNDLLNPHLSTIICIPVTKNLRYSTLPYCVTLPATEGGLKQDSVALAHQLRVLDKRRLTRALGALSREKLLELEETVSFTLGLT